jgi:hypothetical protein
MTPAEIEKTGRELRRWIRRSREAAGLPPKPTPEEVARVVAVLLNGKGAAP